MPPHNCVAYQTINVRRREFGVETEDDRFSINDVVEGAAR
jgi:hypothetical protein